MQMFKIGQLGKLKGTTAMAEGSAEGLPKDQPASFLKHIQNSESSVTLKSDQTQPPEILKPPAKTHEAPAVHAGGPLQGATRGSGLRF